MLSSHIYRIFHSRRSLITILLIILLPFSEIAQLLYFQANTGIHYHPTIAFFLSGTSIGHVSQIVLLWFFPIYFLLICADDSIQDFETGYFFILNMRVNKKTYFIEKVCTSFLISMLVMAISLIINFFVVLIVFRGGSDSNGLFEITFENNKLFDFSIHRPYLAVLFFSIIASYLAGICGALGAALSVFFRDRKFSYPAAFLIWFAFVLKKNSVMLLVQPFAEYGLDILIPTFISISVLFSLIILFIGIYEVNRHDI